MQQEKLNEVLAAHERWVNGEGGKRADLSDTDLGSANLRGANLRGADLYGADLFSADLRGANLGTANLRGADMGFANLNNANLWRADLCAANLREADLCDTNLRDANLRDANLRDADLHGANLSGAYLCDCIGNGHEIKSMQLGGYNITYTHDRLQIGCENHAIEDWWGFDDDDIMNMDGSSALDWWAKHKDFVKSAIEQFTATPPGNEDELNRKGEKQ